MRAFSNVNCLCAEKISTFSKLILCPGTYQSIGLNSSYSRREFYQKSVDAPSNDRLQTIFNVRFFNCLKPVRAMPGTRSRSSVDEGVIFSFSKWLTWQYISPMAGKKAVLPYDGSISSEFEFGSGSRLLGESGSESRSRFLMSKNFQLLRLKKDSNFCYQNSIIFIL